MEAGAGEEPRGGYPFGSGMLILAYFLSIERGESEENNNLSPRDVPHLRIYELFMRNTSRDRQLYLLELRREVSEIGRIVRHAKTAEFASLLVQLGARFHHIIYVALRVHPSRQGHPH